MFCCICGSEHEIYDMVGFGRFKEYIGQSCNVKVKMDHNEVELKVFYTEMFTLLNTYTDNNIKYIVDMIRKQGMNEGGVIHPIFMKPTNSNIRHGQHFINLLPVQENTPATPYIFNTTNKEVILKMIEYFFATILTMDGIYD